MISIDQLRKNFAIVNGRLVRNLSNGVTKPTGYSVSGSWMVSVGGKLFPIALVAWALFYGTWPAFKVQNLAMDPQDLFEEDLVPVAEHRYQYRARCVGELWYHSLTDQPYKSDLECRAAWAAAIRGRLAETKRNVLARSLVAAPVPAPSRNFTVRDYPVRPPKPTDVLGRTWYFYNGSWVSLPEAIHPSDDMRLRAVAIVSGAVGMQMVDGKCVPLFV